DLLSILPTYLSLLLPGLASLVVIRILRVLRIFRILKLTRYVGELNILVQALLQTRRKILVFLYGVLALVVVFGALMFTIEGPDNGFTSIPLSMYWAIVTITTVGYGDITPHTVGGQLIASLAMITGYAIIAVPFGIFSSELLSEFQGRQQTDKNPDTICNNCNLQGHERDAHYCRRCGTELKTG
ncbi:MAG: ion transporter, partial [Pseudohongiellaceae bacterium]